MSAIPDDELVVLDTNILVAYIRANKLAEYIEKLYLLRSRAERPIICVVTVGEIIALGHKFGWGAAKIEEMKKLLADFVAVDINIDEVLDRYAQISHFLYSLQPSVTIQQNDIWIAAVASISGAHLITTDRDYRWLDGHWIKLHWIDETLVPK